MMIREDCEKEEIRYLEFFLENVEMEEKPYCAYYEDRICEEDLYFKKCRKKENSKIYKCEHLTSLEKILGKSF